MKSSPSVTNDDSGPSLTNRITRCRRFFPKNAAHFSVIFTEIAFGYFVFTVLQAVPLLASVKGIEWVSTLQPVAEFLSP